MNENLEMYKDNLQILKENGFNFISFEEINRKDRFIYLRHDVDFSLESALLMAKIEKSIDINSNYFFMISSNFYNIFSHHSFKIIKEIQKLGHNISIHFDLTIYDDIEDGFLREKNIFEKFFETKIDIVSFHRFGSLYKNEKYSELKTSLFLNCMHTYHNKFIKDMVYLSDSGGNNIKNIMDTIFDNEKISKIQLLIHPIWWTFKKDKPKYVLDNWLDNHKEFLLTEIRKNCKTYEN